MPRTQWQYVSLLVLVSLTRKLCYRKDDRVMRLIYMSASHISSQSRPRVNLHRVFLPF